MRAIERLGALDRVGDPVLQSLAHLAAHIAEVPFAAIHIIDDSVQRRIAGYHLELSDHPRADSMCKLSVSEGESVVTKDAALDSRFSYSSFVASNEPVRFFASVPLRTGEGEILGTVCAFDLDTLELSPEKLALLEEVAFQATAHLELMGVAQDLEVAASQDSLTGLANRVILRDRLSFQLARLDRHDESLMVAAVDLDGFKAINDQFGHAAGDEVLREVSRRMAHVVRTEDLVARSGGDEFIVAVTVASDLDAQSDLTGRLRNALATPIAIADDQELQIGAAIGTVEARQGESLSELLERADQAMYAEKRSAV